MTNRRLITAEDLYRMQVITSSEISPDGERVVFGVQRVERKTEKKFTNLWMLRLETGAAAPFTVGEHVDGKAHWSPDGGQLAFTSNRLDEKQAQLFLMPADGGEARPLTQMQGEFGEFAWSPKGTQIVCEFRKKDAEAVERDQDEQKKKLGVVSRRYTRVFYKLDNYGYLPQERMHLWLIDARTGRVRQLTDGAVYDETGPVWSPDGKEVAFFSNRQPDPDFDPDRVELWVLEVRSGAVRKVDTPTGPKAQASWSPDGKWIAYIGREGLNESWKPDGLWVVPADGSGPARCVSAAQDVFISASTINDVGGARQKPPVWSPDSSRLYVQAAYHGRTALWAFDAASGAKEAVVDVPGVVVEFSLDERHRRLAYTLGTLKDPCQVWVREMDGSRPEKAMTRLNQEWLKEIDLGTVEDVWFQGPDGNDLQGWIVQPPGMEAGRKYPCLVEIHGGPVTQYGYFFMHEFYYLAAQGYVVAFSNPRGGSGYGVKHAEAISNGRWGTADYADVMAFSDLLAQKEYVDSQRMGVLGGSYGGYMTNWIIGHTQRFAAAVSTRSVSNFISMWGSSDFNWWFQTELDGRAPYESIEMAWDRSPVKYLGNARTPTLVIHNEMDMRCDPEQGEQVYVALKKLGVDTELVLFPEEPHGLSRTGRTDRKIVRLKSISGWFDRYLKGKDGK